MTLNNNKTAFNYALALLSRQDYSESKLQKKLSDKGYDNAETASTLARLRELGYLNDAKIAAYKFKYLFDESKKSVREIARKLKEQGFKQEDIDAARPEYTYERELDAAKKLLKIKYRKKSEPQKMRALLFRHGFDSNVCFDAVNDFLTDEDDEEF